MAELADLSFECCHLYLRPMSSMSDEERTELVRREIRQAKRWSSSAAALVADSGRPSVSNVVLIDDYFIDGVERDLVDALESTILAVCDEEEFDLHWIAFEADLADSVEFLLQNFVPEPIFGDGASRDDQSFKGDWISNGERERGAGTVQSRASVGNSSVAPQPARGATVFDRGGGHSIRLDVEFRRDEDVPGRESKPYSCPLLASWWQLLRLGVQDLAESRLDRTIKVRADAPPFAAKATLSLLDPRFVSVEHAVRTILQNVILPDEWRSRLRYSAELPGPQAHLDRISYIFSPAASATEAFPGGS